MYIYIKIICLQAQSLNLRSRKLGALPLVEHFFEALQLRQLLAQQIHPQHYVQALLWLVRNFLLQPSALYRIGAWAAGYFLPAEPLGDDVLGRALDRLFQSDRASLMTALIVKAAKTFALQTSQIHNDSTSIKFCGAYEHQHPGALQLRRGFSKDHRPDLKQLVYSLSVSADGAVPVHFKAYDGNQNDDGTHWETWQCLCQLLGHGDFLYVADCKLCVARTLLAMDQRGGRFLTVLPHARAENAAFAQQAAACQVRWQPLCSRKSNRKHQRRDTFEVAQGLYQMN
jgi:transposase